MSLPDDIARIDRAIEKAHRHLDEREADGVSLIRADALKPESVSWLWEGWLARRKLHVLAGPPGAGKTTIALALIAALTSGGRWPDGTQPEPGRALIWSGEDDVRDTLLPRLIACGADLSRVQFVGGVHDPESSRGFDPAKDMPLLREALLDGERPDLILLDPLVNAVAGDSHKNTETRRALQPVVDLAQSVNAAALGITHFSKGSAGRDPVERVTGSLAFGALARVVLAAAKIPEDKGGGRMFCRAKSNIGPDGGGFAYDFDLVELDQHPGITATRVGWLEALEGSARELLADAETVEHPEERTATEEAAEFLRELLADGPVSAGEATKQAKQLGITERPLRNARQRLGVMTRKRAFSKGWEWLFPLPDAEDDRR